MKSLALIAFLSAIALSVGALATDGYYVRQNGKDVELVTPYGTKRIISQFADEGIDNLHLEIPLSDLKPYMAPATPPTPAAPATAAIAPVAPPATPLVDNQADAEEEVVEAERVPASLPPRIIVEYDETDRLVVEANRLYNKRKFYEAGAVIDEILRKKPSFTRAWVMRGSVMKVQGQLDLAKNAWEKAALLEPENKEIQGLLGRLK